ncbi:MAG TPA: SCO family protein [Candidatus Binatia bacterium]|nr:SCO family protein [Candidatus Solibacter sp.]HUK53815.1 SCO family protein [Candidatus Binatia bacterium]
MREQISLRILCALLCCGFAACGTSTRHFQLTGQVISKDPANHTLVVDHEDIPGFMAAMTMPYSVSPGTDLSAIEPGDRIRGTVVVESSSKYWLDRISVVDSSRRGLVVSQGKQLSEGSGVPDVVLANQDGKLVRLSDFRGKTLLLTFVYTRCPLPTFCPLITSQFAFVNKELAKSPKEYAKTQLLTISLDPKYDTPPVLRKYGLAYLNDDAGGFTHWQFAAPSPEDLKKLASAFGLVYIESDNQISHSLCTVLMDPQGKVVKEWMTNEWRAPEALSAIRQVENASGT